MNKLKNYCLLLSFVVFLGLGVSAQQKRGFHLIDIPSPSLEKCIIGSKKTQKIGIYLPPTYYTSKKRFPVVYNLTGYTVHPGEYPPDWIDSIMTNKFVHEMIYVEISGYNAFEGTMYANSPITGNWEDFVTKDVINYIDKNYRTIAKRESRGLSGHSMGGGGSFNIILKHADKYSVGYPMSPAISTHGMLMKDMFRDVSIIPIINELIQQMKDVPEKDFEKTIKQKLKKCPNGIQWIIGYGAAFAPGEKETLYVQWPFDLNVTDSILKIEETWKLWEQGFGSLAEKIEKHKDNLLMYTHLSIDCGYYDTIKWIYEGTVFAANEFTKNKIPFSMHLYNGNHVNRVGSQMAERNMQIMSTYLQHE